MNQKTKPTSTHLYEILKETKLIKLVEKYNQPKRALANIQKKWFNSLIKLKRKGCMEGIGLSLYGTYFLAKCESQKVELFSFN